VTVELLQSLEQYLRAKAIELIPQDSERKHSKFTLSIEDNLGTETLAATSEFQSTKFLDSVGEVKLSLESHNYEATRTLRVSIRLNRSRTRAEFSVSFEGPSARDTVSGIYDGFSRIIEPHRNGNGWVHPPIPVEVILFALGWSFGMGGLALIPKFAEFAWPALGLAGLTLMHFTVMRRAKPYISFESRASERASKVWDWLFWGAGTFLVFGTIATAIRRFYLGF
jgi:hypothetical protein